MSQDSNQRRDLGDGSGRTVLADGSMVGGYRLSYLACGGMSVVYKGEKDGQTVVLKEVQVSNTKEVPSLISEKTLLERLSHPGVVGYHAFFTENGYYYLVVDYVPGEPLSTFLSRGNVAPVADVADWGVQLCDVFTYLHHQQPPIIYRDLKSENILLSDGKVKLIDFGIARVHKGDRQKDTELMGSPVTASPEHYGGAETDARSDIYTLGATIYELLTGGRRKQVGAFQFAPVRDLRPETPVPLDKAIQKALCFKPDERWQTAEEFRNAILKAMGKPVPAFVERRATRRVEEEAPPRPRNLKVVGGVLALLAAIVLAGFASRGGLPGAQAKPRPGSPESSLNGDLFGAGKVGDRSVVFMGEDVGLFQVTPWEKQSAEVRAKSLAKRLNTFYRTACPVCGGTALEPNDIKVGRYLPTGDVVVFYAHVHGFDELHWGPELLATVDDDQAAAFKVPPRFLASYWRDLMRDSVALSRGLAVENSALGEELASAIEKARGQLSPEHTDVENLRKILRETTGKQSAQLRELFERIPDRKPAVDNFGGIKDYAPLRT
jgi:hypothetical protein